MRIPGFIEPGLLRVIQRYIGDATFEQRGYEVGRDLTLSNNPLADVLLVLMNDPKLFRLIRRVTRCGPIGCFTGRLYRMVAREGLAFKWHDDVLNDRKVAISINLSDAVYRGGTLQIRDSSRNMREVPNIGFGDAIIFPVAEHLEHRVTPVVETYPKTAFTGWFCSRPRYTLAHREMIARSESAVANGAGAKKSVGLPSPDDIVKIPDAVVSQAARGETFVANIRTAMCYGLNETGGRIWELMADGHALRSLSAVIAREYRVPRRAVERDVVALTQQLARRDLVKVIRADRPRSAAPTGRGEEGPLSIT